VVKAAKQPLRQRWRVVTRCQHPVHILASGPGGVLRAGVPFKKVDRPCDPAAWDRLDSRQRGHSPRPLSITAVLLGLLATRNTGGLRWAPLVSGLAQTSDAVVGATHAQPGMAIGSTVAALIQLGSSRILRSSPES